jgi:hypothetical protein
MAAGTDQLNIGVHLHLQHRLGHGAQKVALPGLLHELGQCHPLLGHRGRPRSGVKLRISTLADRPDDHLISDAAAAHLARLVDGRSARRLAPRISTTSVDANSLSCWKVGWTKRSTSISSTWSSLPTVASATS